jgi:hypothetical protein
MIWQDFALCAQSLVMIGLTFYWTGLLRGYRRMLHRSYEHQKQLADAARLMERARWMGLYLLMDASSEEFDQTVRRVALQGWDDELEN